MRQMIDSLAILWTEYERRLNLIDSNEYTIKGARHYVWQLNDFMAQNGYTDYSVPIGKEYLLFVENDCKKSKWLYRYKRALSHLNSCMSGTFWGEDFHLCSYSIKNHELLTLYEKLCGDLDQRGFRSNVNNPREYALRCIKHLDLYMLENGISSYSAAVGSSFIDCMKTVSHKEQSCFEQTYTRTVTRLNSLLSDNPMHTRITVDYTIKHDELRSGLDKLLQVLSEQNYSDRSKNVVIRVIKHLDIYMTNLGIDDYTEQVGSDFSDWFNKHQVVTESHDGYQRYILAHFNDVLAGRDFHCCHRESGIPVPEQFKESFELFLNDCKCNGNKTSTIKYKTYCCAYFCETLLGLGCTSPLEITVETVGKSCALINASTWNAVRGYLKSCIDHGLTDKDYSFFVPHKSGRIILPTYYSKEERQHLEAAPDRTTPTGKRDYAIILIINRLGLRSSDVTNITFSNLFSKDGTISFDQYKTGNPQQLPLIKGIEEAVQDYVSNGRPNSAMEEIFVKSHAPFDSLSPKAIHHIITANFKKAGVDISDRKHGGHALRSSLLTSMINNGMTYEEARYVLGHSDDESINHYAALDVKHLRLCSSDIPAPSGRFKEMLNNPKGVI